MTTKIKIVIWLSVLSLIIFKWILPIRSIILIAYSIGDINFYSIFFNNLLYIILSLIIGNINIPGWFLSDADKQWMEEEVKRLKNKST